MYFISCYIGLRDEFININQLDYRIEKCGDILKLL